MQADEQELISSQNILKEEIGKLEAVSQKLEEELKDGKEEENLPVLPSSVVMDVPQYAQTHNASCEASSAHAAMLYLGKNVPEDQIIEEVGFDQSPRYFRDGVLHWGNPQENFVGDIDGEEVYVDGYGVYNEPIYQVLKSHGFGGSISKTGWDSNELYREIRKGYPAIAWISNSYQKLEVRKMVAPDGAENPYMVGEHAVVVRGVDRNNVYIMDVGNGSYYSVTKKKFETGFANLNNMAIVVEP
jgi:uncharacterized protein YvpB